MNYILKSSRESDCWNDEILCVCFMTSGNGRAHELSKRKLLGYFSELPTINPFFTLVLDYLSKTKQFTFYMSSNQFVITLTTAETIEVFIPVEIFEDILINSVNRQL